MDPYSYRGLMYIRWTHIAIGVILLIKYSHINPKLYNVRLTMGALMLLVYAVGGMLALVVGAVLCFAGYLCYVKYKFSHLFSPKLPRTLAG